MIKSYFLGIAIGDALGVPVRFLSRAFLKEKPVQHFYSYSAIEKPIGTWSDDTALSCCLAESIIMANANIYDLAERFCRWYQEGYWSADGDYFEIGVSTSTAIDRLMKGVSPLLSGVSENYANGNGALMRMLPLAFFLKSQPIQLRFDVVKAISGITHAHECSTIGCFILVEYARLLIGGNNPADAYENCKKIVSDFLGTNNSSSETIQLYDRLLKNDIRTLVKDDIFSSGYVVHTLEASLWVLLGSNSFSEAVLLALNLGNDTDTIGSIVGGLAGIFYGESAIPNAWIQPIVRIEDILDLAQRFETKIISL